MTDTYESPVFLQAPRNEAVVRLAETLMLGSALEVIRQQHGICEIVTSWKQGEFHHDTVVIVTDLNGLPGQVLVIATNCNGGIKEVLCFADVPERYSLWHARCPLSPEFAGELPRVLACARTTHWFDPCELLAENARSELKEEYRRRMQGGGWEAATTACGIPPKK